MSFESQHAVLEELRATEADRVSIQETLTHVTLNPDAMDLAPRCLIPGVAFLDGTEDEVWVVTSSILRWIDTVKEPGISKRSRDRQRDMIKFEARLASNPDEDVRRIYELDTMLHPPVTIVGVVVNPDDIDDSDWGNH